MHIVANSINSEQNSVFMNWKTEQHCRTKLINNKL